MSGWGAAVGGIANFVAGERANSANWDLAKNQNNWNVANAKEARTWSSEEADKSRDFNSAQAVLNRNFQERMSNTSISRRVADMKKSGINPLMAVTNTGAPQPAGSAASSGIPSGASAHAVTSHRMENTVGPAIASAMSILKTLVDTNKATAETDNIVQNLKNLKASKKLTDVQIHLVAKQIRKVYFEGDKISEETQKLIHANKYNAVVGKFFQNNEAMAKLKTMKVDGNTIGNLIRGILFRGKVDINKTFDIKNFNNAPKK